MVELPPVPDDVKARLSARFFLAGPLRLVRARPVSDIIAPVREAEILYHPTQLPLARWAARKPEAVEEGVRNFSFGLPDVRQITSVFDIRRIPLEVSPLFPDLGVILSSEKAEKTIAERVPVDEVEVVEWMHSAAAVNAVLSAREAEYNKHSQVEMRSGDAWIPGVRTSSMSFVRVSGYTFMSRGYGEVISPAGRVRVPRGSLVPIISSDFLGWAWAPPKNSWCQWYPALAEVRRLATRITSPVGFPNLYGRVAPLWVLQQPNKETERAEVVMLVDSNRSQRLRVAFRDPNNYTRIIDQGEIDVPAGRSEIRFTVASYPSVPPVVSQLSPEDNTETVLTRFEVRT